MEPKEKAKELVAKFTQFASSGKMEDEETLENNSMECAIICVEEILSFYKRYDGGIDADEYEDQSTFWEEVREEITKL